MKEKESLQTHENSVKANLDAGKVVIYTDGACINNPGTGGYGVVLLYKNKKQEILRKELFGNYEATTNNRMELTACIKALEALKYKSSVIIYTDSQYITNSINKNWAKKWQKNNWQRNKTDKAENPDLWEKLLDLCEKHEVKFEWVKAHAGIKENERCDELAYKAANNKAL